MPIPQPVYLLKDVSRLSGHSIHTIKFYLKRGLIKETGRTPQTGFRYFTDATVTTLSTIRALRRQHKSLADIQQLLNPAIAPRPSAVERSGLRGEGLEPSALLAR